MLALSLGFLVLATSTFADDITSGHSGLETMEEPQIEHKLQISPGFTYLSDADFDHGSLGNVSVWRADIRGRYTMSTEQGELGLGALYEYSQYDLSKFNGNFDFNTLGFDAYWKGMFNEKWGYFVYGAVQMSADTDVNLGDGLTGTGAGGVRYVWSKDLSLGIGAAVSSRLEDDPQVLPVIVLNWQINERWNLRVLNGATLTYDVTGEKKFFMDAGVKYQRREYRVVDDASVTEKMVVGELGATYHFCPHAALRAFVGVTAGRNIEFRQSDHKLGDEDVNSSALFGVRAFFTF